MVFVGWPGEQLLIRLWETLEKAGYGYAKPKQIERVEEARTKARAERMLTLAQAQKQCEAILAGDAIYKDGRLLHVKPVLVIEDRADENEKPQLIEYKQEKNETNVSLPNVAPVVLKREFLSAINIEKIALVAEEILENISVESVSEKAVDENWFLEWRDRAQKVSDNTMQVLWAKILAGEIISPGSNSVRAMDLLSKLSKDEAELIGKLGQFNFSNGVVRTDECKKIIESFGIKHTQRLELYEMGVFADIHEVGGTERYFDPNNGAAIAVFGSEVLLLEGASERVTIPIYPLSKIGVEILKLSESPVNSDYIEAIADYFKGKKLRVTLGTIIENCGDSMVRVKPVRVLRD